MNLLTIWPKKWCRPFAPPSPVLTINERPYGEPLWTLEAGLEVIRALQPAVKPLGYHVALAGGVVNKGHSNKDLDLVFLPLTTRNQRKGSPELLTYLSSVLGEGESLRKIHSGYGTTNSDCYQSMWKFPFRNGRRIDVFIV